MKDWGQLKGVTASEVSQFSLRTSCIFDAAYASDHGFKDGGGENSSLNSLHCIVIGWGFLVSRKAYTEKEGATSEFRLFDLLFEDTGRQSLDMT